MARINNLSNFLNDVASAIKEKTGDNTAIPAAAFDTKIRSIQTKGSYQRKQLTIENNGNYSVSADEDYDALEQLNISVDVVTNLQEKNITENGNYSPDAGYDGFSSVNVNVPTQEINNQNKTITENGSYTADEGYTGLGTVIVNVKGSEDLEEQLAEQDRIITELQEALNNKAGGSGKPNVFMQLDEPSTKNGIWFKSDKTFDNIETADKVASDEFTWNTSKANIPYEFYYGSAVSVGTDIYLFGGSSTASYRTYCYKYDTLTNSYTKMTNIPYSFYEGSVVSIGTDIYVLGSQDNTIACYKYNTLTNSYTKMTNIPYEFYYGSVVSIGTDIYLLGGTNDTTKCYKYDTLTDSYTQMTNIPYAFSAGSAVSVGTDIYLLGGSSYKTTCYKYDTLTNSYTKMTNIPYEFRSGSAVSIGTDIYLLGGVSKPTNCYKYDTLTDTYTQMADIPYEFRSGSAVSIGTDRYLLGGYTNRTKVQVMEFEAIEFTDKTVLIQNGAGLKTELMPNNIINGLENEFKDTYYYTTEGGLNKTIPVYIGNGTEWTKIRGGAE